MFPLRNSSDIIDSRQVQNYLQGQFLHFYKGNLRKLLISSRFIIICKVSTTLFIFLGGRGVSGGGTGYGPGTSLTDRIGVWAIFCSFCKCASREGNYLQGLRWSKRCLRAMRFVVSHPSRKYKDGRGWGTQHHISTTTPFLYS